MILTHCKDLARRSTRGEFEDASWFTRLLIWMHLLMCRHCSRFKAQMELISQTAKKTADAPLEPLRLNEFKKKLLERLGR